MTLRDEMFDLPIVLTANDFPKKGNFGVYVDVCTHVEDGMHIKETWGGLSSRCRIHGPQRAGQELGEYGRGGCHKPRKAREVSAPGKKKD